MDIKVCVAMVTNRLIKPKTVLSLANMLKATKVATHLVIATEGYTTAEGRSYCAIQAIKNDCTHLLFVDDDMTFPEDTIERLLAHGKEIIGVMSNSRTLPLSPTVGFLVDGEYRRWDLLPEGYEVPKELFECYSVGTGILLVDMKVFEKIEKPWFKFHSDDTGKVTVGEDAWLCKQAKEAGFKIYCDPTLSIGHIGDYIY